MSPPVTRTKQAKTTRVPLLPDALTHVTAFHEARNSRTLLSPQAGNESKAQITLSRSWHTIIERAGLASVNNLADGTISELRIHDKVLEAGVAKIAEHMKPAE